MIRLNNWGEITEIETPIDNIGKTEYNFDTEHFSKDNYTYKCNWTGTFECFQGYEEIFYLDKKIYELHFHGGIIL